MTTTFYAPPSAFRGRRVVLPDDEARHAATVLRKEAGDEIVVVDGEGGWHRVQLDHVRSEQVVGTPVETRRGVGEMDVDLTLGVGLLKHRNRFETLVEKSVELGVRCLQPLRTARTEKEGLRAERIQNLLVAALKQSGRTVLPSVPAPRPLDAAVPDADADVRLICHEQVDAGGALLSVLREAFDAAPRPASVHVLVGPEGGFTDAEVRAAADAGFTPVSLGPRRLRAETAGITAAAAVALCAGADGTA
jgi:16S rRNA (uracil1498-N3)-methyltransferase